MLLCFLYEDLTIFLLQKKLLLSGMFLALKKDGTIYWGRHNSLPGIFRDITVIVISQSM